MSDRAATQVYRDFLDALNRQDLQTAEQFVDVVRYREDCVGYTPGIVDWTGAKASIQTVWKGLPDLSIEVHELFGDAAAAVAHGTVRGTATARLYGAPATKRRFQASVFDYVRVDRGLIVERVQQPDVLGQMRQLYGRGIGLIGLCAMFLRLKPQHETDQQPA